MGKTGASSESSRMKALRKQMESLVEWFEEAIVEELSWADRYENEHRPEPAADCRVGAEQNRQRLADVQRLAEEVVT